MGAVAILLGLVVLGGPLSPLAFAAAVSVTLLLLTVYEVLHGDTAPA